jgi:hypothetical protein
MGSLWSDYLAFLAEGCHTRLPAMPRGNIVRQARLSNKFTKGFWYPAWIGAVRSPEADPGHQPQEVDNQSERNDQHPQTN